MRVLIVDDDSDIRDIIEFTFNCEVESEFIHAESGNEAIKIIDNDPNINLIICDYNMPNGNGGEVYKHLIQKKIEIPYAFCSSEVSQDHSEFENSTLLLGDITKPYLYEGIQEIIEKYNQKYDERESFCENKDIHIDVSLDLLLKTKVLPCDIFIKLNNGKVMKVLNKQDIFSEQEYKKYLNKGIENLVISRENAIDFINHVVNEIDSILKDEKTSSESKVFDAHSVIMSTVTHLGLSEKVVRATTSSVDFALDLFAKSKDFKKLEQHIFGHPEKYLTTHSVALSFISVAILKNTKWDSPDTRNKLVLAGFLHDATIRDPSLDESIFNEESKLLTVKEHPNEVQELLKKLKDVPPDVDKILLEHHERPDGSGFPRALSGSQIFPLSSIFIFAHDVVDVIFELQKQGKEISEDIIQSQILIGDYDTGNFSKCYEAFLKTKIFE